MVRSKRVKARRGGSSSSSSLFCFCRKKEEGFMIFCDTCEDWFHVACVGLTEREVFLFFFFVNCSFFVWLFSDLFF